MVYQRACTVAFISQCRAGRLQGQLDGEAKTRAKLESKAVQCRDRLNQAQGEVKHLEGTVLKLSSALDEMSKKCDALSQVTKQEAEKAVQHFFLVGGAITKSLTTHRREKKSNCLSKSQFC